MTEIPVGRRMRLVDNAYFLLTATAVMWAGNSVASKLAVGHVSPMMLVGLRWLMACTVLALVVGPQMKAHWPQLVARWPMLLLMGGLGFTVFNALFYVAGHHTSAINLGLFQGSIPVLVLLGGLVAFGTAVRPLQLAGAAITILGVAMTASGGSLETLLTLSINIGDIYMLIACVLYTGYTLGLRGRPNVPGLVFFSAMAAAAFITSLPFMAWEIAAGKMIWPDLRGWAILVYVAFFPSLLAQLSFMRGVELIGPGRAGIFVNLVPVFAALFAVLILSEPFGLHHALALALVLGGIAIAEKR